MNFCTECGEKKNPQSSFCSNCGTKYETTPLAKNEPQRRRTTSPQKNPMKKSTKIWISSVAALILILFGSYKGLEAFYDPMNDLQDMDQAISSNDAESFNEFVKFDEKAVLHKEDYFQYIKEYEWQSVRSQYISLIENENSSAKGLSQAFNSMNGQKIFTVKPEKELFGLFTSYSLHAEPTDLIVSSSMNETLVKLNDIEETLPMDEPIRFTKIYPGSYNLTGEAETLFGNFEYDETIEILPLEENEVRMDFYGESVYVDTNKSDAKLFINGEDTGHILGDFEYLGPLPEDSNMEFHGEWTSPDGQVLKTDTMTLEDSDWYGLNFYFDEYALEEDNAFEDEADEDIDLASTENDNLYEEISDFVLSFRDDYEIAVNTKDYSMIDSYLQDEGEAQAELSTYISDLEDSAYHYEFTSNEIIEVYEMDAETYEVTTNELFVFTNHLDEQTEYDRTKTYTLHYKNDDFSIEKIEYNETNRD
ncbi:hypothetical protein CEY16_08075 [Halalkalibacillus sediminis]|uniref:Zinc-ribbon domain-containing protein n=1 Tax=Halalkalibacillus sediminis TaxID=2018042 RepID=A0A2I0QU77_9BACI|nr:hypothetical protein [Halalkalibacillus sediminis]PKR77876.1 hypothetical protein CEY16_08075 [Halalkalibacillus sediminis]